MLIKHLRDGSRKPFATIVAVSDEHVGVAVCNNKDQFNKKRGIAIAEGRANCGSHAQIPNKWISYRGNYLHMEDVIAIEIFKMKERAKRYFLKEVLC